MNTRRVAVFALAVLLPVPVSASEHTVECFLGLSPEKKQVLSARASCAVVVVSLTGSSDEGTPLPDPIQEQPPPIGSLGSGAMRLRAAQDAGVTNLTRSGEQKTKKISLLVVGELAEYIAGRDSGNALDSLMGGVRGLFFGHKAFEPFLHVMFGKLRAPSSDDAPTPNLDTWFFGGGADLEVNPDLHRGIVPVVRPQFDWVSPKDLEGYGRVTFGVSFRYEGHD